MRQTEFLALSLEKLEILNRNQENSSTPGYEYIMSHFLRLKGLSPFISSSERSSYDRVEVILGEIGSLMMTVNSTLK